jgi:hypothetical protein
MKAWGWRLAARRAPENAQYRGPIKDIPVIDPTSIVHRTPLGPGQEFAFIPQGAGVLLVTVPKPGETFGIARGADTRDYRDRQDRV